MLYSIVLISKKNLRDIKLNNILDDNFSIENYIHVGSFDYSIQIRNNSRYIIYKEDTDKSILKSSKWKTRKTALDHLNIFKSNFERPDKRKFSIVDKSPYYISRSSFWEGEFIPVVCEITDMWNDTIKSQIDLENKIHLGRIEKLTKKLI